MDNNTKLPEENKGDIKVYTSESAVQTGDSVKKAVPKYTRAKRDIKDTTDTTDTTDTKEENNKTRVDIPTGEIGKLKIRPSEEIPVADEPEVPEETPPDEPSMSYTENPDEDSDEEAPDEESPYNEAPLLKEEEPMAKSIFAMLGKGLLYFAFVLAVSIIAAYYIITMGNDIFAFVKESNPVKITIDSDDGIEEIATMLHENGAIQYPSLFKLYNSFKNKDSDVPQDFVPDTYEFESNLNYDELIAKFEKAAPERGVVDITLPEA